MNPPIFVHIIIGSIAKSIVGRLAGLTWDPLKDPYSPRLLATDLTLWMIFSIASLCVFVLFESLVSKSLTNTGTPSGSDPDESRRNAPRSSGAPMGWQPIPAMSQRWWFLQAGLCAIAAVWGAAELVSTSEVERDFVFTWQEALLVLALTVLIHEAIHLISAKSLGLSAKPTVSVEIGVFAIGLEGRIGRNGMIFTQLAPFLLVTVLLPLLVPTDSGERLTICVASAIVLNAFASGADLAAAIQTWWRLGSADEILIHQGVVYRSEPDAKHMSV